MSIEDSNLRPFYLAILSFMVIAAIVAMSVSNGCPECVKWTDVVEAGTAKGVLYGTAIISVVEVMQAMILLPSEYLRYKFIEPLKQNLRDEGKEKGLMEGHAEGLAEGHAEGLAEGRAEMRAEIEAWLHAKEQAEREGREFNEPMPGIEKAGRSDGNARRS